MCVITGRTLVSGVTGVPHRAKLGILHPTQTLDAART